MAKKEPTRKSTPKKAVKKKATRKPVTPAAKKTAGRPTKFDQINIRQLEILARRGFTDKEMSAFFGVTEVTFNNWKRTQPGFFKSLKNWKDEADEEVEKSLYQSACGYVSTNLKAVTVQNGDGSSSVEMVQEKIEHSPHPTSIIFWLKNRKPDEWRDQKDIKHSGDLILQLAENIRAGRNRIRGEIAHSSGN